MDHWFVRILKEAIMYVTSMGKLINKKTTKLFSQGSLWQVSKAASPENRAQVLAIEQLCSVTPPKLFTLSRS
jgi:hypothetical protein